MNSLLYFTVLIIPVATLIGFVQGGVMAWASPFLIFGLLPFAEWVLPEPRTNSTSHLPIADLKGWQYDVPIYLASALHLITLGVFFRTITSFSGWTQVGLLVSMGISCGALAINIGHELGHRKGEWEQGFAKVLLSTSLYAHFFIEHNRGHHVRAATHDDPATARRGEWVFSFWLRSAIGGWINAWQLEFTRLSRRKQKVWSFKNEMVRWQLGQLVALVLIGLVGGVEVLTLFVIAALGGVLLLETVNYLEHYGLRRETNDKGRHEPVTPAHSWNSNAILGRLLLFELSRHSDHHANPRRAYAALRHFDESPQLPTGYPGMILIALMPPLFCGLMDRRLNAMHSVKETAEAATQIDTLKVVTHA